MSNYETTDEDAPSYQIQALASGNTLLMNEIETTEAPERCHFSYISITAITIRQIKTRTNVIPMWHMYARAHVAI